MSRKKLEYIGKIKWMLIKIVKDDTLFFTNVTLMRICNDSFPPLTGIRLSLQNWRIKGVKWEIMRKSIGFNYISGGWKNLH
ncbi:hypothetical protein CW304_15215 [Bacillus sp. UFRGS-B20]|nr:hypothetical protein CW304_15215 [Bacillus sp. UFRGS-B20]